MSSLQNAPFMGGYGAGDAKLQDSFDFDMFLGSEDSPLPSRASSKRVSFASEHLSSPEVLHEPKVETISKTKAAFTSDEFGLTSLIGPKATGIPVDHLSSGREGNTHSYKSSPSGHSSGSKQSNMNTKLTPDDMDSELFGNLGQSLGFSSTNVGKKARPAMSQEQQDAELARLLGIGLEDTGYSSNGSHDSAASPTSPLNLGYTFSAASRTAASGSSLFGPSSVLNSPPESSRSSGNKYGTSSIASSSISTTVPTTPTTFERPQHISPEQESPDPNAVSPVSSVASASSPLSASSTFSLSAATLPPMSVPIAGKASNASMSISAGNDSERRNSATEHSSLARYLVGGAPLLPFEHSTSTSESKGNDFHANRVSRSKYEGKDRSAHKSTVLTSGDSDSDWDADDIAVELPGTGVSPTLTSRPTSPSRSPSRSPSATPSRSPLRRDRAREEAFAPKGRVASPPLPSRAGSNSNAHSNTHTPTSPLTSSRAMPPRPPPVPHGSAPSTPRHSTAGSSSPIRSRSPSPTVHSMQGHTPSQTWSQSPTGSPSSRAAPGSSSTPTTPSSPEGTPLALRRLARQNSMPSLLPQSEYKSLRSMTYLRQQERNANATHSSSSNHSPVDDDRSDAFSGQSNSRASSRSTTPVPPHARSSSLSGTAVASAVAPAHSHSRTAPVFADRRRRSSASSQSGDSVGGVGSNTILYGGDPLQEQFSYLTEQHKALLASHATLKEQHAKEKIDLFADYQRRIDALQREHREVEQATENRLRQEFQLQRAELESALERYKRSSDQKMRQLQLDHEAAFASYETKLEAARLTEREKSDLYWKDVLLKEQQRVQERYQGEIAALREVHDREIRQLEKEYQHKQGTSASNLAQSLTLQSLFGKVEACLSTLSGIEERQLTLVDDASRTLESQLAQRERVLVQLESQSATSTAAFHDAAGTLQKLLKGLQSIWEEVRASISDEKTRLQAHETRLHQWQETMQREGDREKAALEAERSEYRTKRDELDRERRAVLESAEAVLAQAEETLMQASVRDQESRKEAERLVQTASHEAEAIRAGYASLNAEFAAVSTRVAELRKTEAELETRVGLLEAKKAHLGALTTGMEQEREQWTTQLKEVLVTQERNRLESERISRERLELNTQQLASKAEKDRLDRLNTEWKAKDEMLRKEQIQLQEDAALLHRERKQFNEQRKKRRSELSAYNVAVDVSLHEEDQHLSQSLESILPPTALNRSHRGRTSFRLDVGDTAAENDTSFLSIQSSRIEEEILQKRRNARRILQEVEEQTNQLKSFDQQISKEMDPLAAKRLKSRSDKSASEAGRSQLLRNWSTGLSLDDIESDISDADEPSALTIDLYNLSTI